MIGNERNRLAKESSPYLLQHADNPVDWYPWGEEAFRAAREQDRPIFLSIGYSACHWCHVMERECFQDEEVADLMNRAFISIKVDREERPDVDEVYMRACQMMTGSGGWPLSLILDTELRPFYAATYIPKRSVSQRLGMLDLVPAVVQAWSSRRDGLEKVASEVKGALLELSRYVPEGIGRSPLPLAYQALLQSYEPEHGGFELSPKFPSPHKLLLLFRYWSKHHDPKAKDMALQTLQKMARGGIHDHVGHGFHRYTTDRRWLVPHFEKMLYDQALLTFAYLEAYQVSRDETYYSVVRDILSYVANDMTDERGGFYSSEDADSEGEEGRFYTWTLEEVRSVLGDGYELFLDAFDVREKGNYREEGSGHYQGRNILHLAQDESVLAERHGLSMEKVESMLRDGLLKLELRRRSRFRPAKDDKVLLDWNGLMMAACARAGRSLNEIGYVEMAERAARFIADEMTTEEGELLHRYRQGKAGIMAFLDDHAFYLWGLLELYQAKGDEEYLLRAVKVAERMIVHFSRPEGGFNSARSSPDLLYRGMELSDGAIPSGNSVALYCLTILYHITGKDEFLEQARKAAEVCQSEIRRVPSAYAFMALAIELLLDPPPVLTLIGNNEDESKFMDVVREGYHPDLVIIHEPDEMKSGEARLCLGGRCLPSTDDPEVLRSHLDE